MLTALIIVVVASALNAWINIQIKFAPSREHAVATYKRLFWQAFNAATIVGGAFLFVHFAFISKAPLTRSEVASILLMMSLWSMNGVVFLLAWMAKHLREELDDLNERSNELAKHVNAHADCISHIASDIGCNAIRAPKDKPKETLASVQGVNQLSETVAKQ